MWHVLTTEKGEHEANRAAKFSFTRAYEQLSVCDYF